MEIRRSGQVKISSPVARAGAPAPRRSIFELQKDAAWCPPSGVGRGAVAARGAGKEGGALAEKAEVAPVEEEAAHVEKEGGAQPYLTATEGGATAASKATEVARR